MTWTYRVFRDSNGRYTVREVFYEPNGTLITYSKTPVTLIGGSPEEVLQIMAWCQEAFDLPILVQAEIEQELAQRPASAANKPSANLSLKEVRAALEQEVDPVAALSSEK